MSAGLAGPIVTHAALVNAPREPGSYQPGTAIGTMVNRIASHASSHFRFLEWNRLIRDHGGFITNWSTQTAKPRIK